MFSYIARRVRSSWAPPRTATAAAGGICIAAASTVCAIAFLAHTHDSGRAAGNAGARGASGELLASASAMGPGWTWYSDPHGRYAFGVPPSWHVYGPCAVGQTAAGEGSEVRIAPHDDVCGVDGVNDDIIVDVLPSSSASGVQFGGGDCSSTAPVTVDGVAGTRVRHLSSACGDAPAEWYRFSVGGAVITAGFDHASFCDFSVSPAPPAASCGGTRGDFTSTLDIVVAQTLRLHR